MNTIATIINTVTGTAFAATLTLGAYAPPTRAQWIVSDPLTEANTLISQVENIAQTIQQIKMLEALVKQARQLTNLNFGDVEGTINRLLDAVNSLDAMKQKAGGLNEYLAKFRTVEYYRGNSCYTAAGCSAGDAQAQREDAALGLDARKKANDAVLQGIDKQQTQLVDDARRLTDLQTTLAGTTDRDETVKAAAQLAQHTAAQLLQMRTVMSAQYNMMVTKSQVETDRKAKERAAYEYMRSGNQEPVVSPNPRGFTFE